MPSQKYSDKRKNDESSGRVLAQRNQQQKNAAKTSRGRIILKANKKCDICDPLPKEAKNVK